MIEKRFTTVELPKPNKWGIWYDGAYLSTYQVCILLNEHVDVKKENEHIKNTIQEAYNNERTHIGKSVLKQLMEAIQ